MTLHFERQNDSTHILVYGNESGELLATYWPSEESAEQERTEVLATGATTGARIDSLAELDALENTD